MFKICEEIEKAKKNIEPSEVTMTWVAGDEPLYYRIKTSIENS